MFSANVVILLIGIFSISAVAQDGEKRKLPMAVSHLPKANQNILRMKNSVRHTMFNKVLCFKVNCRKAIGWQHTQKQKRFNGYKDVPQVRDAKKGRKPVVLSRESQPFTGISDTVQTKPSLAPLTKKDSMVERTFVLSDVLFDFNSPVLKSDFTSQLDSLVNLLESNQTLQVFIVGHTDNTGRESYNLRLSTARAEAVGLYLIDKGINPTRIQFEGKGSSEPIADNATEDGRQKNRRVVIMLRED